MPVNAKLDAKSIMIDKKLQSLTPPKAAQIWESYQWINLPKGSKKTRVPIALMFSRKKPWITPQSYWTQRNLRNS